jgi:hypothetical protein
LKVVRGRAGKGLCGRALVALDLQSGLVVAFRAHPDGHANEARLLPDLVPPVRQRVPGPRLWVADRQFGDLVGLRHLAQADDHFVVRYHKKTPWKPDLNRSPRTGTDRFGRSFTEDWGWLSSGRQRQQRYLRRITLHRPKQEAVVVLTDLLDETTFPAADLLDIYLERWGIERTFQQVSEVFHLLHLIGSTPEAAIFQFGFCLLLYNLLQVIRAVVAETQTRPVADISTEQLFYDLRRELITLHTLVDQATIATEVPSLAASQHHWQQYLRNRLAKAWTPRWLKSPRKKYQPPRDKPKKQRSHVSIYRAIQEAKSDV